MRVWEGNFVGIRLGVGIRGFEGERADPVGWWTTGTAGEGRMAGVGEVLFIVAAFRGDLEVRVIR